MAWQDSMLIMLRAIINDVDCGTPEYSDERLRELLVVAAQMVQQEIRFSITYTIDLVTPSISPDPVTSNDDRFINFVVLKAACMIDRGNMRAAVLADSIRAKCGPMELTTLGRMKGFDILINQGYCAAYEHAKFQDAIGDSTSLQGILSPFTNQNILGQLRYNSTRMRNTY